MSNHAARAKEIFLEAVELEGDERVGLLNEACQGDAALRARVDELIAACERQGSFMERPAGDGIQPTMDFQTIREGVGTEIGPFKLLQQLGEGGFGVVYMAEQQKPVRRKVALKIIKPGMDTKEVIARFEAERQALALMDHPNIAKVLDAGETESGRPYFVMELVKGLPLTEYCDRHDTSLRERLELFQVICRAVQHAHQKGVIHRDLKPSNIMITLHDGVAVPKVIDFGVSKAISQQLTERTLFTAYGAMVGTPAYMSPEQAEMSGLDVDTRSDVYSLGVVLYELLTGGTPLEMQRLRGAAYAELQRLIREEEPPRPSNRLSTIGDSITSVAKQRGTDPRRLSQFVRGDLDWIVMRALEKDRNRRYDSPNAFAADVERFLEGAAVDARPPTLGYRLSKFAGRHRVALATGALVALALVAGMIGTGWQAYVAGLQRDRADAEAINARAEAAVNAAVIEFLNVDLLGQANPRNAPDRDLKLRAVLDNASRNIEGRFSDQPQVEAAIRRTLGEAYLSLAENEAARQHLERALVLYRKHYGETHEHALAVQMSVGWLEHNVEDFARSEWLLQKAAAAATASLGAEHALTLEARARRADVLRHLKRFEEAEPLFERTIGAMTRTLGPNDFRTLECRNDLAMLYQWQGRLEDAAMLHAEVLEVCRTVLGPDNPRTLESVSNLADVRKRQKRYPEATTLYVEAYEGRRRVLGDSHPNTLNSKAGLADIAEREGRTEQAVALRNELWKASVQNNANKHIHNGAFNSLVRLHTKSRNWAELGTLYNDEYQFLQARAANPDADLGTRSRFAEVCVKIAFRHSNQDELEQALKYAKDAAEQLAVVCQQSPDINYQIRHAKAYWHMGGLYQRLDRKGDSLRAFQRSAEIFDHLPADKLSSDLLGVRGQVLYGAGRYQEARRILRRSIDARNEQQPTSDKGPRWWYLAMALHQLGEEELAQSYYDQLVEELEAAPKGHTWRHRRRKEFETLLSETGLDEAIAGKSAADEGPGEP